MSTSSDFALPNAGAFLAHALARNWWMFLVRGLVAIAFGVLAILLPGLTVLALVLLYGAYALVDGLFALVAAFRGRARAGSRWWLALVGVLGIVAGIVTFFWPALTVLVLVTVIGAWSLARGLLEIVGAITLRKEIKNEWLLILHGAAAMLFGIVVLFRPAAGALALIWLIGALAIASGVLLVGFALRLRRLANPA
jgi:uncharacterized membrane protein HdeD (DUF308 family)